jgi:hypothetical protein
MVKIAFDEFGKVSGLPDSIPLSEVAAFEIIGKDRTLSEDDDCEILLSLESPRIIETGEFTFTFGGDSFTIAAQDASPYGMQTGFNRLASIVSAGGVWASGNGGIITVGFDSIGTRGAISISHNLLGSLTGRCRTVIAGSVSVSAVYELDLTIQTLAKSTTATDIEAAEITVANVVTGDADEAQRDTITFSRLPNRGKWQIWTGPGSSTAWLSPEASSYAVEMALEDIEPGLFLVSREERGGSIIFDLRRADVGANSAPTVANTFIGPAGVTMSLDLSRADELIRVINGTVSTARLTFTYEGVIQFSQIVSIPAPVLLQPQPL